MQMQATYQSRKACPQQLNANAEKHEREEPHRDLRAHFHKRLFQTPGVAHDAAWVAVRLTGSRKWR
jgi:hypothetical protein